MSRSELLAKYKPDKDNLLLIIHDLQNNNAEHYVSTEDIAEVAKYLNLTFSSVYGVVTYYSMFSLKPRGKYIIRVCCSPVCGMESSENIIDELMSILAIGIGDTSSDGLFTLETTECIGQCAESPGMIINDRFFGNLNPYILRKIIDQYKSGINDI
jgi:NADH-quinone oxidoreductase subunit E